VPPSLHLESHTSPLAMIRCSISGKSRVSWYAAYPPSDFKVALAWSGIPAGMIVNQDEAVGIQLHGCTRARLQRSTPRVQKEGGGR
jgi:hypothetical protein